MKKAKKGEGGQAALSVEQDIVGLITTLVQKLVSLEAKIDTVLGRLPGKPGEAPRLQPVPVSPAERHKPARQMYRVICADCGKQCEVPFQPAEGRPVYCRECFSRRKASGTFAPRRVEARPGAPVPLPLPQSVPGKAPPAKPAKTPAAQPAGKPAAKKKAPAKKAPAKKAKKKAAK